MSVLSTRLRRSLASALGGVVAVAMLSTVASAEPTSTPSSASEAPTSTAPASPENATAIPDLSEAPVPAAPSVEADSAEVSSSTPEAEATGVPSASEQSADQQKTHQQAPPVTSSTAATGYNPEGTMGAWTAGDGLIYFSGYAFDRDDFGANVVTMYTLNGAVVGFQSAQLRSSELDAYGLPNKGVFGAFQARLAGGNELCMFVFNVGEGADVLASCVNVDVPPKNPRGDFVVDVVGGQIRVNGWLFDESYPHLSLYTRVFITGGPILGEFDANAPSPYLHAYGVFGNHGFGLQYAPQASGSYEVCVFGYNVGFGMGVSLGCETVTVTVPTAEPAKDDPVGAFTFDVEDYDGNGFPEVYVDGWAYDPNSPMTSLNVALFLDGEVVGPFPADEPSPFLHPYGVFGNHAISIYIGEKVTEIPPGTYQICLYGFNVGAGSNALLQCEDLTV